MKILDNILDSTARGAFGLRDWFLTYVFSLHWAVFAAVGMFAVIAFFVGKRLKNFINPDLPRLSPFIRFIGEFAFLGGFLTIFGALVIAIAFGVVTFLGANAEAILNHWDQWAVVNFYFLKIWQSISLQTFSLLGGGLTGALCSAFFILHTLPMLERGMGLRDVRAMHKLFTRMKNYSPLEFIDLKKGIFVGLEDGKHPVHVPIGQFRETHTQVIGASGSGKGIALGLLAYQFVLAGESLVIFDPKGDKRLPLVAALAAKKASKKIWIINLGPDAPPQFNLFAGATASEIEELLISGLGLQPTAGDGDYYRGIDQDAAASVAQLGAKKESPNISTLFDFARQDPEISKADNFVRRLKQISQMPSIQTSHDFNFAGILSRGDVLYIHGSTDNHRVKALQTMLLIRLLQIIKKQKNGRKVALILDEFKHLLCSVSLDALGTVRELGCHTVLAHQSMGDLGMVQGMRREDVEPRVVDNTTLKLVFRLNDAKASKDFAARSGKQRTHVEGVRGLDKDNKDQRTWTEAQQFRMSEDLFTHLLRPSDGNEVVAAGVLFGYKTARLLAVSPINVKGSAPSAIPAPPETIVKPKSSEALI